MMRGLYLAAFLVAVTLTYGLYSMKYEVQRLETKLTSLHDELAAEREAMQVLRAEWSYLNGPERLEELTARHLDLVPVSVHRMTAMARIPLKESSAQAGESDDKSTSRVSTTSWRFSQRTEKVRR